jgi:poly-beta-1,6-N-acetyl-D-glucosamine synthase
LLLQLAIHSSNEARGSVDVIFWVCLAALVWAYLGYPVGMVARGALRAAPRTVVAPAPPPVTVVLPVRNGAGELVERVRNLLAQDYRSAPMDIVIVTNGSADGSDVLAAEIAATHRQVRWLSSHPDAGKAGALNAGVAAAAGEIIVFADVRQRFEGSAVSRLVQAFGDPHVGGVTGRLVIGDSENPVVSGVGRYWQLETSLRIAEGKTGSVIGATGAIYAVRRDAFRPLPPAIILDDVYLPLDIVRRGYRMVMAPDAVARDRPSRDYDGEYRRRVRTLVGNYELLRLMPGLLNPVSNPVFVRYVSHKLLRLLTPALCLLLTISGLMAPEPAYRAVALALVSIYAFGALGLVLPLRVLALPSAFLLLHTAGFNAMLRPFRVAADLWN